ncbi:Hsp20/alpha crystallin family protein [Candidatus Poribacteria bacterium]|nr:Hsp20/alpha crystallin family protein [Candidatus Poribacteria bacterium]
MKVRRDPFGEFFEIQRQMDQVFDAYLQRTIGSEPSRAVAPEPHLWRPAMDVYETVDRFIVKLELPGIQPDEDVKITLERNVLTVRGNRRDRAVTKKEHYHLAEVNYGLFERAVALPDAVDLDASPKARYDNGFLEITIPKAERHQPREIEVEMVVPERRIQIDAAEESPDTEPGSALPVTREEDK